MSWRSTRVDLVQRTDDWLQFRQTGPTENPFPVAIGASRIYSLIERDPAMRAELFGMQREQSFAMSEGQRMEPQLREEYEARSGKQGRPEVWYAALAPWVVASLDWRSEDGRTLAEFKLMNGRDFDALKRGTIPGRMYAQVQAQLACSGAEVGHLYAARWGGRERTIEIIEPDPFYQTVLWVRAAYSINELMNTFSEPHRLDDVVAVLREIDPNGVLAAQLAERGSV